jgi:hypothetical protein
MKLKTKGAILTLALTLAIGAVPNFAFAGAESDPKLAKLEQKFFHNEFVKEDVGARLDRLEKLVFGEAKAGDADTRLQNLVAAVPNLDETVASGGGGASTAGGGDDTPSAGGGSSPRTASNPDAAAAEREATITDGSKYPAVTALEKKLLGRDFASEALVKRLDRLETKVFGKPSSNIDDLSERMDRLKAQTGVDLARTPPAGSDWADDEDGPQPGRSDIAYVPERPMQPGTRPTYNPGDDPMFNNSRPRPRSSYSSAWGGGGSVGGSSGSYGGLPPARRPAPVAGDMEDDPRPSGSYGSAPPRRVASLPPTSSGGIPPTAPDVVRGAATPPTAMGLSQQVALLENEIFNRSYTSDPIPMRLDRLEATVFPGTKRASDMPLPQRVQRLNSAVAVSQPGTPSMPQVAQGVPQTAPDYQDAGMPPVAPQRGQSGLGKIINGLGNLLMGAPMYNGAYPTGSNLVQDPTTGLLIDRMTGNMIDPTTGVVVRQGVGVPITGGGAYGAYNGFNNGLSPIGAPYGMGGYGMGSGMRFGFGGSGIRFGGGGMGMGMGSGMGTGFGYPIGTQTWP